MTDLTYCYLHMSRHDFQVLDTLEAADYINGELSDDELDIPPHMVPPNPDDSDILPSQVHPSYPYGNPTNVKHPANRPRPPYDPSSRALFEDMGYAEGGINGALRWRDLALDELLPVDEAEEEAKRATQARKMTSGATQHGPQAQQHQQQQQAQAHAQEQARRLAQEEGEDDGEDEDEDDEDDEDINPDEEDDDEEEEDSFEQ